jgi:hypothetical protein
MKKTFLLFIAASLSLSCLAQRSKQTVTTPITVINNPGTTARTTAVGDTKTLTNIAYLDPIVLISYPDSTPGYIAGTNSFGDKGFAERYYFNGADSSMKVTGIMSQFGGKVTATSTKSVNFRVWGVSLPRTVTGTIKDEGFPQDTFNSKTVSIRQLGIGIAADTLKTFMFDTATRALNGAFFVGYDINYTFSTLAGDTIGLASTAKGHRSIPVYYVAYTVSDFGDTTRDTVINVQNATQYADGTWHENYTDNDSVFNDFAIFPIVVIGNPTGVNSVVKNNLSLFGNFPNPATYSTSIRFALAKPADVTIRIIDMAGQEINHIYNKSLSTGTHTVIVATNELPSGNYIYTIQTSTGDALASQMSIVK